MSKKYVAWDTQFKKFFCGDEEYSANANEALVFTESDIEPILNDPNSHHHHHFIFIDSSPLESSTLEHYKLSISHGTISEVTSKGSDETQFLDVFGVEYCTLSDLGKITDEKIHSNVWLWDFAGPKEKMAHGIAKTKGEALWRAYVASWVDNTPSLFGLASLSRYLEDEQLDFDLIDFSEKQHEAF